MNIKRTFTQNLGGTPQRWHTFTDFEALSDARDVWFLVSGNGKRAALQQLKSGESIPAATIKPRGGIDVFTDMDI